MTPEQLATYVGMTDFTSLSADDLAAALVAFTDIVNTQQANGFTVTNGLTTLNLLIAETNNRAAAQVAALTPVEQQELTDAPASN